MWPAIIGAIGSIAGNLISSNSSSKSSSAAIEAQAQAQRETNAANMEIANVNRQVNIDMSNTAHQRQVKDLAAAGLNPILSASLGGSSTPLSPIATMENPYGGLVQNVNSANQIQQGYQKNIGEAATRAAQAALEWKKGEAEINLTEKSTEAQVQQAKKLQQEAAKTAMESQLIPQQFENLQRDSFLKEAQTQNYQADSLQKASQVQLNSASIINHAANAAKTSTETEDLKAEMFAKENERKQRNKTGYVTPYINAAGEAINSATKLSPRNLRGRPNYVTP